MSKKLLLASELRTLRSAASGVLDDSIGSALVRSCHTLRDDGLLDWDGSHWTVTDLGRAALEATATDVQDPWLVDCDALKPSWQSSATSTYTNSAAGSESLHAHV